jgi:hypothetical protein
MEATESGEGSSMKTITLDTSTPEGRAAAHAALQGRSNGPGTTKRPRKAKGEGTGSRPAALNELAGHGWVIYASDDRTHRYTHVSGRVVEAESYDALLNMLLVEIRSK